ncbi:MAG TPA: peptidase dimerization domain-containing protein, partial [Thermoanaerobaculia bacterium]|nr:peptidase dimerization domain-containing protein [Thermoanaerobaculia bacterium]
SGEPSDPRTVRFGEKGPYWLKFTVRTPGGHGAYSHTSKSATKIAAEIIAEIQQIEAEKIPVILVEPYFDRKTPDFIAAKSGAVVVPFYPSVGGLPEIRDYFSLFDHNVEAFVTAMKGRG